MTLSGHPDIRHGVAAALAVLLLFMVPPASAQAPPAPAAPPAPDASPAPEPAVTDTAPVPEPAADPVPVAVPEAASGGEPDAAEATPDATAERRAAHELARGRGQGEVVQLRVGEAEVLALWRPREALPDRGSVVLLHAGNGSLDDPAVIGPLRRDLPGHGFATLALMLPVPAEGAAPAGHASWQASVEARLGAAIRWLGERNAPVRALVGHGAGAAFIKRLLTRPEALPESLRAVVLIDLGPGLGAEEAEWAAPLALPLLDLVGGGEEFGAERLADARRASALRQGAARYRSVHIVGVHGDWRPARGRLLAAVRGFLLRYAAVADTATAGP
jgi:hypothetical protein